MGYCLGCHWVPLTEWAQKTEPGKVDQWANHLVPGTLWGLLSDQLMGHHLDYCLAARKQWDPKMAPGKVGQWANHLVPRTPLGLLWDQLMGFHCFHLDRCLAAWTELVLMMASVKVPQTALLMDSLTVLDHL